MWRGLVLGLIVLVAGVGRAEELRKGEIVYRAAKDESKTPERFRLADHSFDFDARPIGDLGRRIEGFHVRFPSAVTTPHENNNTVHAEYYRAKGADGKRPAVVVLHILGGEFPLSRLFATALAEKQVNALFIKMPYYGPRRQPGVSRRMVSKDPRETVEGMTQAILDIRRGAAWLASQPEVDADQLGVFGISLGGITAALSATAEPRFVKVCPMLAGGDIGKVAWESPELRDVRAGWQKQGGTKEQLYELMQIIDPCTYADNVKGRKILMLNASQDEIIPKRCTEALWTSFGQPRIVWYDAGHISALRYLVHGVYEVTTFFQPDGK